MSRDGAWLARMEGLAARGGWPFEARAALPAAGRTPPPERALAVLDRGLAGSSLVSAVGILRSLYPQAAIVLACDDSEMGDASAVVSSGADEVLGKSWADEKIASRLSGLRDRALASQARVSSDGALKAERRSHRVLIRARGKWKEARVDAGGFALLWLLLRREGEPVTRDELGDALAEAMGRERELGTLARRLAALRKALAPWSGKIESARGGYCRLVSATTRPKR